MQQGKPPAVVAKARPQTKKPPAVVAKARPQTTAAATGEGITVATFQVKATVSSMVSGHTARLARALAGDPGRACSYSRSAPKRSSRVRYEPATKATAVASLCLRTQSLSLFAIASSLLVALCSTAPLLAIRNAMAGGLARLLLLLLLLLALLQQFAAGASDLEAFPPSPWNRQASLPRKWMKGTAPAPAAAFCGSEAGSYCCSVADEQKLREAFLAEVQAHGYHDAECRSELKAYICAVCLPSAPADDPFSSASNTTTATNKNNSSLPLRCAGAATVTPSISTNDPESSSSAWPTTEPATPTPEWLVPDTNNAPTTTPKWLIAILSALAAMLGGFVTYKICKAICECECGNNIQFCSNNECCLCCL